MSAFFSRFLLLRSDLLHVADLPQADLRRWRHLQRRGVPELRVRRRGRLQRRVLCQLRAGRGLLALLGAVLGGRRRQTADARRHRHPAARPVSAPGPTFGGGGIRVSVTMWM